MIFFPYHLSSPFFLQGFWRVLELDYKFKVMSDILALIEEEKWPLEAVPRSSVIKKLCGSEPESVLGLCVDYYFNATGAYTLLIVDLYFLCRRILVVNTLLLAVLALLCFAILVYLYFILCS